MSLAKREKKLLYFLAIVTVVFVVDLVINSDDYSWITSSADEKEAVRKKTDHKSNDVKETSVKKRYQASLMPWNRDPFYDAKNIVKKKVKKVVKKLAPLTLKAISIANAGSVAMINDKVLMAGDVIAGYTVERIEAKQVVLSKNGKKRILKLQ